MPPRLRISPWVGEESAVTRVFGGDGFGRFFCVKTKVAGMKYEEWE